MKQFTKNVSLLSLPAIFRLPSLLRWQWKNGPVHHVLAAGEEIPWAAGPEAFRGHSKTEKEYYRLFTETNEESNRGELTPFVVGFLQLIAQSFDETLELLRQELRLLQKDREWLKEKNIQDAVASSLTELLLEATLFGGEGLTMEQLCEQSGKSRMTVQKRLDALPEGILTREKNGKAWVYKIVRETI